MAIVKYTPINAPKSIEDQKANAKAQIIETITNIGKKEEAKYSYPEINSFNAQEIDYRAYLADTTAKTPTLNSIANRYFADLEDIEERRSLQAQRIAEALAKRDGLIGVQQSFEKAIDATTTKEEIEAVLAQFNATLGGV